MNCMIVSEKEQFHHHVGAWCAPPYPPESQLSATVTGPSFGERQWGKGHGIGGALVPLKKSS